MMKQAQVCLSIRVLSNVLLISLTLFCCGYLTDIMAVIMILWHLAVLTGPINVMNITQSLISTAQTAEASGLALNKGCDAAIEQHSCIRRS